MKGTLTLTATDEGIGCKTRLEGVSMVDKFHILHVIEDAIEMKDIEIEIYNSIGRKLFSENCNDTKVSFD